MPNNPTIDNFELQMQERGVHSAAKQASDARQSGDESVNNFRQGVSVFSHAVQTAGEIIGQTNTILASRELTDLNQRVYKHINKTDTDFANPKVFQKYSDEINQAVDKIQGKFFGVNQRIFENTKASISNQLSKAMVQKSRHNQLSSATAFVTAGNSTIASYEDAMNSKGGEEAIKVLRDNYERAGVDSSLQKNILKSALNSSRDLSIPMDDIKASLERFGINPVDIHEVEKARASANKSEKYQPISSLDNLNTKQKGIVDSIMKASALPNGSFNIEIGAMKHIDEIEKDVSLSKSDKREAINLSLQAANLAKGEIARWGKLSFYTRRGDMLPSGYGVDSPQSPAASRAFIMNKIDPKIEESGLDKTEKSRLENDDPTVRGFVKDLMGVLKVTNYPRYIKLKRELASIGTVTAMSVESDEPNELVESMIQKRVEDRNFSRDDALKTLLAHSKSILSSDNVEGGAPISYNFFYRGSTFNELKDRISTDKSLEAILLHTLDVEHHRDAGRTFKSLEDLLYKSNVSPLSVGGNTTYNRSSNERDSITTDEMYKAIENAGGLSNTSHDILSSDHSFFFGLLGDHGDINVRAQTEDGVHYAFTDMTGDYIKNKYGDTVVLFYEDMKSKS